MPDARSAGAAALVSQIHPEQLQHDLPLNLVLEYQRSEHKKGFPFSDNLLTLIFIIFTQMQEQQRLLLTQHMEMKNLDVH